jgi:hypothetical protein
MTATFIAIAAAIGLLVTGEIHQAAAASKCSNISARCAVEVGGQCDPQTGRWVYGRNGAGGTNKSGAFDACLARERARRR